MKVNLKSNSIKLLISVLLTNAFFYSCQEKKENVLITYFPNDKQILYSEYIINDNDTILHGKFTLRDYDGKKIISGNYKNGKRNGAVLYYFNNGNIESIDHQDEKQLSAEIIYNYEDGKIKKYCLYDDLGKIAFILNFDKKGNVKSYEGLPVMEIYQYKLAHKEQFNNKTDQFLKVGDTLKYKYLLANIPNAKRTFKIETVGIDNSTIQRISHTSPPARIDVEEVLTKKGKYQVNAIVKYKFDDEDKTVINDTIPFDVIVN